ncbi:hypothetical protein [Paenibacillus eucommiae]|uniref:Uncharacterized protein n=1 Tax=Paenibacillus eucommiae TaxID=1355755 RepID=A0ABS4IUK4_9BACL|nr:hypothetical protein [Paenibacillus eucommiae]MBP1991249.1 hypothetical protein [Paenibacillus eucommiae]
MHPDFLKIKSLEGDLRMSHKKKDYGLTVTTKELILHKPHVNYYFKLDDIISIVPYEIQRLKNITFVNWRSSNQESTNLSSELQQYKLFVQAATVHNRSGIFKLGPTDVIIPIHEQMLQAISECGILSGLVLVTHER